MITKMYRTCLYLLIASIFFNIPLSAEGKVKKAPAAYSTFNNLAYLKSVEERLLDAWSPAVATNARVVLTFRIHTNGTVSWIEYNEASPSTPANNAAKDSISFAKPFPKIPAPTKYIDVKVEFKSNLSRSYSGGYCRPTKGRSTRARQLFKSGFELSEEGDLKGAVQVLQKALAASPFDYHIKKKYIELLIKAAVEDSENAANYLHKAMIVSPRNKKVQAQLNEFWKSQGKDPLDFKTRFDLGMQYDKNGQPFDAVAEYGAAWELKQEPYMISPINLACKHLLAWRNVEKWKRLHKISPSPSVSSSLANALHMAGAYKKAAEVWGQESDEDFDQLRLDALGKVSKTNLSPTFPFGNQEGKEVSIALVKNRKRIIDYLAHATKARKAVIRWTPGRFPLKVYVKNGYGIKGYRPIYNQMVVNAFNAWAKASRNRLSFVPVGGPKGANIVVTWTANPGDLKGRNGREQGVTHFKYRKARVGNYTIVGADIRILTVRRWKRGTPLGTKLMASVILHELGHALGISGHSPYRSDIMYPALNPFKPTLNLSSQDAATIVRLYQGYEH